MWRTPKGKRFRSPTPTCGVNGSRIQPFNSPPPPAPRFRPRWEAEFSGQRQRAETDRTGLGGVETPALHGSPFTVPRKAKLVVVSKDRRQVGHLQLQKS